MTLSDFMEIATQETTLIICDEAGNYLTTRTVHNLHISHAFTPYNQKVVLVEPLNGRIKIHLQFSSTDES